MPKFAANLTMMFTEVEFLERFEAAATAGFTGVEYLFPYDYPKDDIVALLQKNNLTQVLHNLPAGDWVSGDRGIACIPDRVDEFQEGVGKAIDYATALGCTQLNCLAGIPPNGVPQSTIQDTLSSNLLYASEKLLNAGIRLLIEPINTRDIPGFYLQNTNQARDLIKEIGSKNLFLQYDIYHMQIMEGDLAPTIEANLEIIKHIQIADNPGRNEPGTGEINYPFLFNHLDKICYKGWVGCEYKPLVTTSEGLGWASHYLS